MKLKFSYKDYPSAAIEVLDENGEPLGFLAERIIPGFGDNVLDHLAFLLHYDCIQARVVSVTPLPEQKDGAETARMEVKVITKKGEKG